MIKQTFYNLDEEKREKIIAAALKEFTQNQYSKATVTNICRLSGIPKGSFYQYFDDKLDCLIALLDKIVRIKMTYVNDVMNDIEKIGFFEGLKRLNLNLIKMMDEYPEFFELTKNIYGVKEILPVLFKRYAKESNDFYDRLINTGLKTGEINPDLDRRLVIIHLESIQHSFTEYMKSEFLKDPDMSRHKYMKFADMFFDMICHGIGRREHDK